MKHFAAWMLVFGTLAFSGCGREADLDDLADLNTAIYKDDLGTVKAILGEKPKLVNWTQYPSGRAPLHNAAYNGATYVVEYLISDGAEVNAVDDKGLTPLHYAANYGVVDNAKVLIENGAQVNALDYAGRTPLHGVGRGEWFANMGAGRLPADHEAVARLLLSSGARTGIKDEYGRTALDYAKINNELTIVELLEKHQSN